MSGIRQLSADETLRFARSLEDRPENVIARDQLFRGEARAWLDGSVEHWTAAVIETRLLPGEPIALGTSASVVLQILREKLKTWSCVEAEPELARRIGEEMQRHWGINVKYYGDVYYELRTHPPIVQHANVRLLTEDDLPLVQAADESLMVGTSIELLSGHRLAAAIVDGRIVAKAGCYALSERYADVGVQTLEPFRCRGLSTAAASLLIQSLLARGLRPTWSTGEDNLASQRVAAKLGFQEISRCLYVIPVSDKS